MAALCCVYLLLGSLARTAALTPKGVHCPTAPVQEAVCNLEAENSGHRGSVLKPRKPKPGEPGFVQCRCAEKKAASTASAKESTVKGEAFTPALEPSTESLCALALNAVEERPRRASDERGSSLAPPPPCPPPKA